ncbi:MAG TPA: hypothetical protein VFT64_00690 [Rickettsiales bacterium]|nr:hypothetical protein [Rickettsiales bacterium]
MRKLTAALILTTIVAGGAYTYYWTQQANVLKANFEQSVAQANEQIRALNKDITFLRYESVTTSGFPFLIRLDIAKPVIELPLSSIAHDVASRMSKDASAIPESKDDARLQVTYSDKISLSTNMMYDRFTATLSGDMTLVPSINGKAHEALVTTLSSPTECHLAINHADRVPQSISEAFSGPEAFFDSFRSIDCDMKGAVTKYADSAQTLSTVDGIELTLTSEPMDQKNKHITLHSDLRNVKATPAYDEFANTYLLPLFYDLTNVPQAQRSAHVEVSQLGEQNSLIDATYEGPLNQQDLLDPTATVKLDVQALNSKNALYDANNEAHFNSSIQNDERHTALNLHSNLTVTSQYEDLMTKQLTLMLGEAGKNPMQPGIIQSLPPGVKPEVLANALVPKLHNAGKMRLDADLQVTGSKNGNIVDVKKLDINNLDLLSEKGGLKLKGSGTFSSAPTMPVGDITITCVSCDTLVDDIGGYSINIDDAMAPGRPGQVHYVTPQLVEGVKQFLHAISEQPTDKTAKDIDVKLVSDSTNKVTVSGKQPMEVIGLFGVNVGQNLQHVEPTAPNAGTATPAPAAPAATPQPKAEPAPAKPETAAPVPSQPAK